MHKKTFNNYLSAFSDIYPKIRYLAGVPQRPSPREWLVASNLNYEICRATDMSRAWLYIDLAGIHGFSVKPVNWFRNYITVDFQTFQDKLNLIYEMCRRESWQTWPVSRFKAEVKKRTQMSVSFLLAPLWSRVESFLLSNEKDKDEAVDLMRDIVQWTRTAQKCRFVNADAEEAAYLKFRNNDERLFNHWRTSDSTRDYYLARIRQIISNWRKGYEFNPIRCTHGSGASSIVGTGRSVSIKCKYLCNTDKAIKLYDNRYSINPRVDLWNPSLPDHNDPALARWLTVDKNATERRGIGPQDPGRMWRQQGIKNTLYEDLFTQPFYRKHMPIFDRTRNQVAAIQGSKDNKLATWDLSSASDSVAVHLVKAVYTGTYRTALLANRSKAFDREPQRRFTTYATMGDASTFPSETEIIAACVQLSLDLTVEFYNSYNRYFKVDDRWVVFGDDIIVQNDAQVLRYLEDILTRLGFIINKDKSFYYGPYRESCGVEAYLGRQIEPFYVRYKPKDRASRVTSLISLCNHCFDRGYKALRQYYLFLLEKQTGKGMIPFTELNEDSSRVHTAFIDVTRIRTVFNKRIWELEYKAIGIRSPKADQQDTSMLDNYGYYTWLLTHRRKDLQIPQDRVGHTAYRELWHDRRFSSREQRLRRPRYEEPSTPVELEEKDPRLSIVKAPVRLFVRLT